MKLNLGSGNSKREGFTNIDVYPFENVHVVHDIEQTLPFDNEVFDEIYSRHTLEHCSYHSIPHIFSECYRVLQHGGKMYIEVPCLEHTIRTFLEMPEDKRWSYPIEYIYGNQGRSLVGQQFHKTGFTESRLRKLALDAGFRIDKLDSYLNALDMKSLRLYAIKQ